MHNVHSYAPASASPTSLRAVSVWVLGPGPTGIPGRRIKKGVGPVSGAASGIDPPSESARWAMEGWRN